MIFRWFSENITPSVILWRPRWFCPLCVCSLGVLGGVRYQKQLLAAKNPKYIWVRSCPPDSRSGPRIRPKARPGHLPGAKIIGISWFFDNFVKFITRNVIVSRPWCFCPLCVCSLDVLGGVKYQKQLLAVRNPKYIWVRSCPVGLQVRTPDWTKSQTGAPPRS